MIDHQTLRESFKPNKIKILFIAESPPKNDTFFYSAKSGFCTYTKQIFNELFEEKIDKSADFLHFFQNEGFFLDDLCHEPKTYKEIFKNKDDYIKELQSRLKLFNPQAIIKTPKRINNFVREAIKQSNLPLNPELIFILPFPGMRSQNEYMSSLWGVLHFLISKDILTKVKLPTNQRHRNPPPNPWPFRYQHHDNMHLIKKGNWINYKIDIFTIRI